MHLRLILAAFVVGLPVLALTGCGSSGQTTVTVATPVNQVSPPVQPATTTATSATPAPAYPVVPFSYTVEDQGTWPYEAQLVSITENPNGFGGSGGIPPGKTFLMVQLNVTSGVVRSGVPPPDLTIYSSIVCHGSSFGSQQYMTSGWNEGETTPDSSGMDVAMGDGRPHAWDTEYEVPEGTPTASVKCQLKSTPPLGDIPVGVKVQGSGRLN
jgi:hypothetical protein